MPLKDSPLSENAFVKVLKKGKISDSFKSCDLLLLHCGCLALCQCLFEHLEIQLTSHLKF